MKRIKLTGLASIATLAIGVLSVTSAPAHLFLATAGELILAVGQGKQLFTPHPGGAAIACNSLKLDGKAAAGGHSLTQILVGQYSGNCSLAGTGLTISPVEYEFTADESVKVLNEITIFSPSGNCTIKITPGQVLNTIRYLKDFANAKALLLHAEISGIHMTTASPTSTCGVLLGNSTLLSSGEYRGLALVLGEAGGAVIWE